MPAIFARLKTHFITNNLSKFQWWMQHLLYQDEFIPRGLDSTGRDEFGLEYGGIEFGCQTTHRINEIIQNGIEIQLKQKVPCGLEDGFRVLR